MASHRWGGALSLLNTSNEVDPSNDKGYVISAIGVFSGVGGYIYSRIISPSTNPVSSVIFDPNIDISSYSEINGLSDDGDAFFFGIPIDPTDNLDNNGYFNANMSFASVPPPATVPGPLPLLGAAVGFSLSRRLRKRIQATK